MQHIRELVCYFFLLLLLRSVATFLEANGRGYWDANEDQLERLRQMYMDVEDKIEGEAVAAAAAAVCIWLRAEQGGIRTPLLFGVI
jgi:hypothetical protein